LIVALISGIDDGALTTIRRAASAWDRSATRGMK
jgi:hypothetical protein